MRDSVKGDTIKVFFFAGLIETTVRIRCEDISLTCKNETHIDSLVFLDSIEYNKISNFIRNDKQKEFEVYEKQCDCRIILNNNDKFVCFGEGKSSLELNPADLEMSYFIKSKTGYYDYFSESDLKRTIEIQKFGMPDTYHFHKNPPNNTPKEAVKILLVSKPSI